MFSIQLNLPNVIRLPVNDPSDALEFSLDRFNAPLDLESRTIELTILKHHKVVPVSTVGRFAFIPRFWNKVLG